MKERILNWLFSERLEDLYRTINRLTNEVKNKDVIIQRLETTRMHNELRDKFFKNAIDKIKEEERLRYHRQITELMAREGNVKRASNIILNAFKEAQKELDENSNS